MNRSKVFLTFLLLACFTFFNVNCVKRIDTPAFGGSYVPSGVAERGMEHSAEVVDNCLATAENLAQGNPDAYVNCRVTQEEAEVVYDPNPPPPPEPQSGLFYSTTWDVTRVTIIGSGNRVLYRFEMRHGDQRIIDLMPGYYAARLQAGARSIDVGFDVDNNHNDSPLAGRNYDFYFEVTRI